MRDYYAEMQKAYEEANRASQGDKKISFSVCPSTSEKPCRLCDLCKIILFNQRDYTAQQIEMARDFNRKDKFYLNTVFIVNPSEVVVVEVGSTIGNKLVSYEMDPNSDLKGFWHKDTGRNLNIVKYPNPDKRKTKYDVEPRIAQSPLIDKSVLDRMYDLDRVIEMARAGELNLYYQSKFPDKKTEIRVLPSWLGPKYASIFQLKYRLHYHTSEEELAAIQRGELNPFADFLKMGLMEEPKPIIVSPVAGSRPIPTFPSKKSQWEELGLAESTPVTTHPPTDIPLQLSRTITGQPRCHGTFDPDEEECARVCAEEGWMKACKEETEAKFVQRKAAKGLYR